jgi:hypothetical protein
VFGNPYGQITAEPGWLRADVKSLAQSIYELRSFDRMPALGEALRDAGCTNPEVLGHARRAEGHVRGCWLLDAILGRQ